jgi:hypothetical protein
MKFPCLLLVLGLFTFSRTAHGIVMNSEIKPEWQDYVPLAFDIHSERLPNGDIQFIVKISENLGAHSRFLEFPKVYGTSLGIMKITEHSQESRTIRSLSSERQGNVVKCNFFVTKEELENPDFVFRFSTPAPDHMPGGSNYFARLKKFLKP